MFIIFIKLTVTNGLTSPRMVLIFLVSSSLLEFTLYKTMIIILITIIASLLTIAFFTIAERKLLASIQRRKGPNVTGF